MNRRNFIAGGLAGLVCSHLFGKENEIKIFCEKGISAKYFDPDTALTIEIGTTFYPASNECIYDCVSVFDYSNRKQIENEKYNFILANNTGGDEFKVIKKEITLNVNDIKGKLLIINLGNDLSIATVEDINNVVKQIVGISDSVFGIIVTHHAISVSPTNYKINYKIDAAKMIKDNCLKLSWYGYKDSSFKNIPFKYVS